MSTQVLLVQSDTHKNATSTAVCASLAFGCLIPAVVFASRQFGEGKPKSEFRTSLLSFCIIGLLVSVLPFVISAYVAGTTAGVTPGKTVKMQDAKELLTTGLWTSFSMYAFLAVTVSMSALAVMRILYGNMNGGQPSTPLLVILGVSLASMAFMGYPVYQFFVQDTTTVKRMELIVPVTGA
jgi:hypothetical protein